MDGCINLGSVVISSSSLSTLWLSDLHSLSKTVITLLFCSSLRALDVVWNPCMSLVIFFCKACAYWGLITVDFQLPKYEGGFFELFSSRKWYNWYHKHDGQLGKILPKIAEYSCCINEIVSRYCSCSFRSKFEVSRILQLHDSWRFSHKYSKKHHLETENFPAFVETFNNIIRLNEIYYFVFRGLRMLSLVLGSGITDASVAAIVYSFSKLELLDLSG